MTAISLSRIIPFHHVYFETGDLTSINQGVEIPFNVNRIYYLTGVESGESRGNHANIKNQQIMVALRGSFKVTIDDGKDSMIYTLDSHHMGLYVPNLTWRSVHSFSEDSICLVLCSESYDPEDYVKDYKLFKVMSGK